jgi:diacylglycerol kinase (ATP)
LAAPVDAAPDAAPAPALAGTAPPQAPWLVVVNPVAGRTRRNARAWARMETALRAAGVPFELAFTARAGDGCGIAAGALRAGRERFLVAGGDGSVHDVVNGLMSTLHGDGNRPQPTPVRVPTVVPLPLGTGNDWSRSLGLPRDPASLAAAIRAGRTRPHDVGRIDFARGTRTHWFVNVAGAGFDAHVLRRLPARAPGSAVYLAGALRELSGYRASRFRIATGDGSVDRRLLLAFVAIGQYCGGRMHVAPAAVLDDGRFELVTIDEVGLAGALPRLAKLYLGTLPGDRLVGQQRVAWLEIAAEPPAGIEADGQWLGETPARFSVVSGALRTLRAG